ncbi:MAG TPA: ribonuclease E/G, partial [Sphingomicrobium sp.]
RSTREHNIEQTAFTTNLEAAQEIARQLRLRDMAGLIVIDFIDMEQNSHVRKVEKAMKEALKNDRARIQVGRISSFGLMEMSRQRLRTGVLEASTKPCPHCDGTGLMRTAASAGLSALRIIEDEATRGRGERITLRAGKEAAVYVLNKKRGELADIEQRYGVSIEIHIDESFEGARMTVDSSGARPIPQVRPEAPPVDEQEDDEETVEISLEDEEEEAEAEAAGEERESDGESEGERHGRRRRRRRRGGRGRGRREGADGEAPPQREQEQPVAAEAEELPEEQAAAPATDEEPGKRRRRRRGRKSDETAAEPVVEPDSSPMVERPIDEEPAIAEVVAVEEPQPKPKPKRRSKKAAAEAETAVAEPAPAEAPPAETADQAAEPAKPARKRRTKAKPEPEPQVAEPAAEEAVSVATANNDTAAETSGEPRRGWWQRTFG